MQCKDIPTDPILNLIWEINNANSWAHRGEGQRSVLPAFPDGYDTPEKLVLAKMRKLMDAKLIDGCPCGCRGDYVVIQKGADRIGKPNVNKWYDE